MRTSPLVDFALYDPAIKQDSTPATSENQPFSKVADLEIPNSSAVYGSFEPNFWLLDGKYKLMPTDTTNVHVGLMSLQMSNSSDTGTYRKGDFTAPHPKLTITFTSVHSTDGLTFIFSALTNDFIGNMTVEFFNSSDVSIDYVDYSPTTAEFYTNHPVANFKKIVITFLRTNKPYRYLRLQSIDYGQVIHFTGADIKSCVVVEEVNPLSTELPIGTLELFLFSSDATFSIINPTGDYTDLQNKQPLDVYEVVGNDQIYIGHFFLDTWENPSDNIITFKASDTINILESSIYLGGLWGGVSGYATTDVITLIAAIMGEIDLPYDLDPILEDVVISGWIPVCTYREALKQIAFVIGATVSCSRGGVIRIYADSLASELAVFDFTILKSDKGMQQSLVLKPLVTGVEIIPYVVLKNSYLTTVFSRTLAIGSYRVLLSEPTAGMSRTGTATATWTYNGGNYVDITVTVGGTVILDGQGYTRTGEINGVYNGSLDASVKPNIIRISDATLVSAANVGAITQKVYDYYQQRYLQKMKLYAPEAAAGDSVLIDTLYDRQIGAIIEKMTLDLSGGFTAKVEATGVVIPL